MSNPLRNPQVACAFGRRVKHTQTRTHAHIHAHRHTHAYTHTHVRFCVETLVRTHTLVCVCMCPVDIKFCLFKGLFNKIYRCALCSFFAKCMCLCGVSHTHTLPVRARVCAHAFARTRLRARMLSDPPLPPLLFVFKQLALTYALTLTLLPSLPLHLTISFPFSVSHDRAHTLFAFLAASLPPPPPPLLFPSLPFVAA